MLEIKVTGSAQTGKTNQLKQLIFHRSANTLSLWVSPTRKMAKQMREEFQRLNIYDRNIHFIGVGQLIEYSRGVEVSFVALDNFNYFPVLGDFDYFDWVSFVKAEVLKFNGTLAYSVDQDCYSSQVWVSNSVWYKPWTWGTGSLKQVWCNRE